MKEGSEVDTTYLMPSRGLKDSDDWKSRYVFIRPRGSDASQVWSVHNEWTLNIKHPRKEAEDLLEPATRVLKGSNCWKDSWLLTPYLMSKGLDGETCKCHL